MKSESADNFRIEKYAFLVLQALSADIYLAKKIMLDELTVPLMPYFPQGVRSVTGISHPQITSLIISLCRIHHILYTPHFQIQFVTIILLLLSFHKIMITPCSDAQLQISYG